MLQTTSTVPFLIRQRIARTRTWQTLRTAAWLEWQSQGNWTNPWLFLLYLVVRPLTAALVLVFMYWVISGYRSHGAFFGFLIVCSAAWSFVDQVMAGPARPAPGDRGHYSMLQYVYIVTPPYNTFLI